MELLVAHSFCCFFMTGLIWLIQLVHYPAFSHVGEDRFQEFAAFHSRRITWIVAPVMFVELATATLLWWTLTDVRWLLNFSLLILIWMSTAFLSVRCHNELALRKSASALRLLVLTNWPRTLLWSFRSTLLIALMLERTA